MVIVSVNIVYLLCCRASAIIVVMSRCRRDGWRGVLLCVSDFIVLCCVRWRVLVRMGECLY